jgi:hypothetical protein
MNSRVAHINILDYDIYIYISTYIYIYPYLHMYIYIFYICTYGISKDLTFFFALRILRMTDFHQGDLSGLRTFVADEGFFGAGPRWGIFGWEVMGEFHVNIG